MQRWLLLLALTGCSAKVAVNPPRPAVDPVPWTPPSDEPGPAAPAPPSEADLARARESYDKGMALYQSGEFAAARIEFAEAYQHGRQPAALFQLARCEYALGDVAAACSDYADYQAQSIDGEVVATSDPALDRTCRTSRQTNPDPQPVAPDPEFE
jgi:hypothetical protein